MRPNIFFVDVGQGTCNIVIFDSGNGRRSAIIIDAGPSSTMVPLEILHDHKVGFIEAIVVSHNDRDHIGGVTKIVDQFRGAIRRAFYVGDRSNNLAVELFDDEFKRGGILRRPIVITVAEQPTDIFPLEDSPQVGFVLKAISPQGHEGEKAREKGDRNAVSAVILLDYGGEKVLFPGDAKQATWQTIFEERERAGQGAIEVGVIAVPHHGGRISNTRSAKTMARQLQWLYNEVLDSDFAVMSAATGNQYLHPRLEVLNAIYDSDTNLLCTEMTVGCVFGRQSAKRKEDRSSEFTELIGYRPSGFSPSFPSRGTIDEDKLPCMGTVGLILNKGVKFLDSNVHDYTEEWGNAQANCCPICEVCWKP